MNFGKNKIWEFAGSYYRINLNNLPIIVIDRAQTVGYITIMNWNKIF